MVCRFLLHASGAGRVSPFYEFKKLSDFSIFGAQAFSGTVFAYL